LSVVFVVISIIISVVIVIIIIIIFIFNYYFFLFFGWEKIEKNTKRFEVEKLVQVVIRGKTLNGNKNALK